MPGLVEIEMYSFGAGSPTLVGKPATERGGATVEQTTGGAAPGERRSAQRGCWRATMLSGAAAPEPTPHRRLAATEGPVAAAAPSSAGRSIAGGPVAQPPSPRHRAQATTPRPYPPAPSLTYG